MRLDVLGVKHFLDLDHLNQGFHPSLPVNLVKANVIVTVPAGHIGKDHLVTFLQTTTNFDSIYRAAPHLHLYTNGASIWLQEKHAYGAVLLPEGGTPDV